MEDRKRVPLVLIGLLILIHGLAAAYLARPVEMAPQTMSEVRGIQLALAFRYLWVAIGVLEAGLGVLAAANLMLGTVHVGLVILGVVSCFTLAIGTGLLQIGLGIALKMADPGPATGIQL